MPLLDSAVRAAKPAQKPYKLFDERGLFLLVTPTGGRLWRLKYRVLRREKSLSLGSYPDVPLRLARERRDDARRVIAAGGDPSDLRREQRAALAQTFEGVAREWIETQRGKLKPITFDKKLGWLEKEVFPKIGAEPVARVSAQQLLPLLRDIEARGNNETAHRIRSLCGNIMRYAMATGRAHRDPTVEIRGALAPVVTSHRAAITYPARIGDLMRAIDAYRGQPTTQAALKLAPLTFVRPAEPRGARWCEFQLDGPEPEWRIPGPRMKQGREHVVPLSRQAVAVLDALRSRSRGDGLLFTSLRSKDRPISESTINVALKTMGFDGAEVTGHGFRAMASTCLNEQNYPPDVIELQLAHAPADEVRAAYNRASRMPERRAMMQAWADYLDKLRATKPAQRFEPEEQRAAAA